MKTKYLTGVSSLIILGVVSVPVTVAAQSSEPPIVLTIEEPGGSILSGDAQVKNGKVKDKNANLPDLPTLFEDGWVMSFRLAAPNAEAYIRDRRSFFSGNFDTLVLEDPDGCLNLSGSYPIEILGEEFPGFVPPPFEDCTGPADETAINFFIDPFDAPGVRDRTGLCAGFIERGLVDDEFGDKLPEQSNKVFVDPRFEDSAAGILDVFPVGPDTGGPEIFLGEDYLDCYGYGTDDDLPSLVVMVNIGAAKIFDEDLNYDNSRIRNMAGLLSGVGLEFIDNGGASTIVAHMPITRNMINPLTFVDVNSEYFLADYPDPLNIVSISDGVETVSNISGIETSNDLTGAVLDQFPDDYDVEIRAVVVNGIAPAFIDDMNGDGEFTAQDVALMNGGTQLLSNEAVQVVNLRNLFVIVDEEDGRECAPSAQSPFASDRFLYVDLDGSFDPLDPASIGSGVCNDGDGTSRSGVRRPR